jgi:hypothetical protein
MAPVTNPAPFRHQQYDTGPPTALYHVIAAESPPVAGSDEFDDRMKQVGHTYKAAGVVEICLAHGTFVGGDATGLLGGISRVVPSLGETIHQLSKALVDGLAGDAGNFTEQYVGELEAAINRADGPHISVKRLLWSSENHHIGRADGAVRFLDELIRLKVKPNQRVLTWAHSHAGNVLALVTNLLCGDPAAAEQFFAASHSYYHYALRSGVSRDHWQRVEAAFKNSTQPTKRVALDVVTMGTPIRYAWHPAGYDRLLHFVHHRPAGDVPPYRAVFPPTLSDLRTAAGGDYVHSLGIAGTNLPPGVHTFHAWRADRQLARLLQPCFSKRKLLERLKAGKRVADAGTTLLVDYGQQLGGLARHIAGHAVYTRREWMLFHAEEVARRLYEEED